MALVAFLVSACTNGDAGEAESFDIRYEDAEKVDHYEMNFMGDGLRYELAEFVSKINRSDKKDFKLTAEESIRMADVVERFMQEERGMK